MAAVARSDFWPVSGDAPRVTIQAGQTFEPDHALVTAFPSMFNLEARDPLELPLLAASGTPHRNGKE